MTNSKTDRARARMVARQIEARGLHNPRLLEAFRTVPREAFVPADLAEFAFDDRPLSIGEGQTISQPYIVALTIDALALTGDEYVLDVGTGSGYAAAVASRLAARVVSIERLANLARAARGRFALLEYDNIEVVVGDGSNGHPPRAPYDAIMVAAGGPEVPDAMRAQLAVGGRLVMPVGDSRDLQELVRETRQPDGRYTRYSLGAVRFVPLLGAGGWPTE